MQLFTPENIEKSATTSQWIKTMEVALLSAKDNNYKTPNRMHVEVGSNTLLIMPSIGPDIYVTKLVSVFPKNASIGKPVIHGNVIVNNSQSGETLAIMDGGKLTAMRTAAVAVAGLSALKNEKFSEIGIVGAGEQGRHLAWMAAEYFNLDKVHVYDRSQQMLSEFKDFLEIRIPSLKVVTLETSEKLLCSADVIFTATSSNKPVLPDDESLFPGKTIVGIGSYKPDMREFPDALFRAADNIWIDADHGKIESGDLIYPVEKGLISKNKIRNISYWLNNPYGDKGNNAIVFKTVGLAIFDLFAARLVYENTMKNIM